jgi:limonene-1,2-epoxide hydrolase
MPLDITLSYRAVQARLDAESEPRRRKLLQEVRDHIRAEVEGRLDDLMATLTADPVYHNWGTGEENGPKGRENVRTFYEGMIAGGANLFEFDVKRIFVDEGGVVTEGRLRQRFPGAIVRAMGVSEVGGEPVDPAASYITEMQLLTVWPGDAEGKLVGEDIYFGTPLMGNLRKA